MLKNSNTRVSYYQELVHLLKQKRICAQKVMYVVIRKIRYLNLPVNCQFHLLFKTWGFENLNTCIIERVLLKIFKTFLN